MHFDETKRTRSRFRGKHSVPELALSDTRLSTWEERDRAHVELINTKNDATIVEWWDDDVRQAIEDGFLKPGQMHRTAYDYAVHVGLIERPGQSSGEVAKENPRGFGSKGDYEVWVDGKELLYSGPNKSEADYRFIMAAVNYKIGNVVERNNKRVELMMIGARGKRETMVDSTKLTDRQLQDRWNRKPTGFAFRENPVEARDFTDPTPALKAAVEKYGATHVVWRERKRGPIFGVVWAYTPMAVRLTSGAHVYIERKLEHRNGLWHWPRDGKKRTNLPADAELIEDVVRRESQEARECACDHCAVKENPVDVSDGIPWVKTERNADDFKEIREIAQRVGPITGARSIYDLMEPWVSRQNKEHLCVILLDIHSDLLGVAVVHIGTRDRVTVDPADVLKPAIDRGAKGLCIMHNHPSGSADHSTADASLTKAIKKACDANDIAFVDHVVIGAGEYYSFADKKLHKVK